MLAIKIKQKAMQIGFASCGIIPAAVFEEYNRYLYERIRTFPESKKHYEPMLDYAAPPETAKAIVVCLERINKYRVPDSLKGLVAKHYLFEDRIPYSPEYRAQAEFGTYLKTQGLSIVECSVPDRWAAAKAGLGKFGRNNFLYSLEHGSYVRIVTWVVDKTLEYDPMPLPQDMHLPECSDGCQKCVKACPTNAFSGCFSMDMGQCVAYLTFNAEDALDEATRLRLGRWLYGCDVCQDVCPANKGKLAGNSAFPLLDQFEEYLKPEVLLAMDEEEFYKIVYPRFWYGGKETFWRWRCNALRSMINSKKEKYHQLIDDYLDHGDERLRGLAQWGCANR